MWSEARIARQRINASDVREALLMQSVIGAALSKKGKQPLDQLIKKVLNSD